MRLISSSRMTSAEASGPELGDERAGRRVDHLKADDFGRLEIGASLETRELGVADGREDHAEECLPDAGHAAQQQVARVDLPLLLLVVRRRDFRQQDDIGERLGGLVADQGLAALGDDRVVKGDGFFEIRVHDASESYVRSRSVHLLVARPGPIRPTFSLQKGRPGCWPPSWLIPDPSRGRRPQSLAARPTSGTKIGIGRRALNTEGDAAGRLTERPDAGHLARPPPVPVSFASILKSRLPFGAIVPLPVRVPNAGATRFRLSARMPSGATRSVAARVWICVSLLPALPAALGSARQGRQRAQLAAEIEAGDRDVGQVDRARDDEAIDGAADRQVDVQRPLLQATRQTAASRRWPATWLQDPAPASCLP